ncbi:pilin [Candidatus Vampirococcus lugosii]|uniref:Uncharacterized protein n=1 Tax=Candidatus Vampirococcus lugosii TaxID=2789015 RepID=A0ABS5QMR2_9BACT|nr:pilin [Candidatus Vampirococcus lugosii]MBS8122367.1 hypothetical protein [Candidatus Vampirococcus lugosii]
MIKKFTLFLSMSILTLSGLLPVYSQSIGDTFGGSNEKAGGVGVEGAGSQFDESFLGVVKSFVNWVLGIMSLIALIVLLWGAFQMVTAAGNEEKYGKGFTILKQAAIGLILMGVAWFIVSIIFSVIATATGGAGTP